MRTRISRAFAHLRQQWIGTLALFLVLTGGVAYAADTIGSSDIIDEAILSQDIKNGEVKNVDIATSAVQSFEIGNNQVRSIDVRNDTLSGGGLTGADIAASAIGGSEVAGDSLTSQDLADNAVGTSELQGAVVFDSRDGALDDPVAGGASEVILLTPQGHQVTGRCLEDPAGTVTASIVVKSVGIPRTSAVDGNGAPNGVNVTDLAHGAEATLVSLGPGGLTTWQTGQYAVTSFLTGSPANSLTGFNGNVAVATKFGGVDCRFQATALGGALGPGS